MALTLPGGANDLALSSVLLLNQQRLTHTVSVGYFKPRPAAAAAHIGGTQRSSSSAAGGLLLGGCYRCSRRRSRSDGTRDRKDGAKGRRVDLV